jgi:sortase A
MRPPPLVGNILVAVGAVLLIRPARDAVTGLRAQAVAIAPAPASSASRARPARPLVEGEALGRLEVPRLGLNLAVFEGTSEATLRKGPGHLAGTAWPGGPEEAGNCVIAGHRDSFFRRLAAAREGDLVRLHRPSGIDTYRLQVRRIVEPQNLSVIAPTPDARLTLVTCYPFSWVGAAPYRLIWTAVPLESAVRTASPFSR